MANLTMVLATAYWCGVKSVWTAAPDETSKFPKRCDGKRDERNFCDFSQKTMFLRGASSLLSSRRQSARLAAQSIHTLAGTRIDGSELQFSTLAGKPALLLNVASC